MDINVRPAVFIGSSSEGLSIAESLQILLDKECEVEVWNQGVFGLSQMPLDSLIHAVGRFDFAVLVLTADDADQFRQDAQSLLGDLFQQ